MKNLFLLKRTEEAALAYDIYLQAGSNHPNIMIAQYRTAQIFHEQGEWDNCLSVTSSILENPPQEKLFQLCASHRNAGLEGRLAKADP